MFEDRIRRNLKENEELVVIIRKFPLVFILPIIFSAVFIIAPFFFMYPLFHWSSWGVGIFFTLLIIGLFIALRTFIIYSFNVFVITNQRIIDIDQAGLFDRTVSETTYDKIQDVSFRRKGISQTLWRYGSVVIQTAGQQANIELIGVKNPEKIQQLITEIQKETVSKNQISSEDIANLLANLESLKKSKENSAENN